MAAYETKVILSFLSKCVARASSVEEAYECVAEAANVEGAILPNYNEFLKNLEEERE